MCQSLTMFVNQSINQSVNQSINQSINLLMSCMGGDFPLAQQGKLRMGFCLSAYLVVGGGRLLNC